MGDIGYVRPASAASEAVGVLLSIVYENPCHCQKTLSTFVGVWFLKTRERFRVLTALQT